MTILMVLGSFVCGSLMFSYWLGMLTGKNIRSVGDGNPGAANLWKAAGVGYGLTGIILDFIKGYLPVFFLAGSISGYWIIPFALAPILGHAFSPFLRFRGGKAIAVTFGVWSALTEFKVSLAYAIILALLKVLAGFIYKGSKIPAVADAYQTLAGLLLTGLYLYWGHYAGVFYWIWLGNFLILLYKCLAPRVENKKFTVTG